MFIWPENQQSTINPAFAAHFARHLREANGDLHSVFDSVLEIARGEDPTANGHDRLRAVKMLSDRAFGKVSRKNPSRSEPEPDTPIHHYHDHVEDDQACPEPVEGTVPAPAEGKKAAKVSHRNIAITGSRLYFSREDGRLRLKPPTT